MTTENKPLDIKCVQLIGDLAHFGKHVYFNDMGVTMCGCFTVDYNKDQFKDMPEGVTSEYELVEWDITCERCLELVELAERSKQRNPAISVMPLGKQVPKGQFKTLTDWNNFCRGRKILVVNDAHEWAGEECEFVKMNGKHEVLNHPRNKNGKHINMTVKTRYGNELLLKAGDFMIVEKSMIQRPESN